MAAVAHEGHLPGFQPECSPRHQPTGVSAHPDEFLENSLKRVSQPLLLPPALEAALAEDPDFRHAGEANIVAAHTLLVLI
jgi:hypothetical protein